MYICIVEKKKIENLEDKSKVLHKIVTKELFNRGYLARKVYDIQEPSSAEAKRASSKFSQKINGKSSISDKELVKIYRVLVDDLIEMGDSIKLIAKEMEALDTKLMVGDYVEETIKTKNMTADKINEFKQLVKKQFG
jgi:hypothetical protein